MAINAIVACDTEYGIGKDNGLPWPHYPKDMKWFRDNTADSVVVMGSKTWKSIGYMRLPTRLNVVLSCNPKMLHGIPDIAINVARGDMGKMLQNLQMEHPTQNIWVIGGGDIYKQALPYCEKLYLTTFKQSYECDIFLDSKQINEFNRLISEDDVGECVFSVRSRG